MNNSDKEIELIRTKLEELDKADIKWNSHTMKLKH